MGLSTYRREVSGQRVRARAASFSDHFSQATLFWESMSPPEREHIIGAFSFELGKCLSEEVKERVLANLANVDAELTKAVATTLGKASPKGKPARGIKGSPALSLVPTKPAPIAGRKVGILAADHVDAAGVRSLVKALASAGAVPMVIAPHGGKLSADDGGITVDRAAMTTQSVEYDALVVAGGRGADVLGGDPYMALYLGEAFRHYKPIAAWGEGRTILEACDIPHDAPGVVTSASANRGFAKDVIDAISWHRHWTRALA